MFFCPEHQAGGTSGPSPFSQGLPPTGYFVLGFPTPIPKRGNAKERSNYFTIVLISHASKVMFKILQARLQQHMNCEIPDIQAGFRKGRRNKEQIASIHWIIEKKKKIPEKYLLLLY